MLTLIDSKLQVVYQAFTRLIEGRNGSRLVSIVLLMWSLIIGAHLFTDIVFYDGALHINNIQFEKAIKFQPEVIYLFPRFLHRFILIVLTMVYGNDPRPFSALNILLHSLNCLLVFRVFHHIFHNVLLSFLIALSFSVGLHCQIIGLTGAMSELLLTALLLGALWTWMQFLDTLKLRWIITTSCLSLGAYCSRDTSAVLPFLFLSTALFYPRRTKIAHSATGVGVSLLLLIFIPLILTAVFPPLAVLNPPLKVEREMFLSEAVRILTLISNNCLIAFFSPSLMHYPLNYSFKFPLFAVYYSGVFFLVLLVAAIRRTARPVKLTVLLIFWCLLLPSPYVMLQRLSSNVIFPLGNGYPIIPFQLGLLAIPLSLCWRHRWVRIVISTLGISLVISNYQLLMYWWRSEENRGRMLKDIAELQMIHTSSDELMIIYLDCPVSFSTQEAVEILTFYTQKRIRLLAVSIQSHLNSDRGQVEGLIPRDFGNLEVEGAESDSLPAILRKWKPTVPVYLVFFLEPSSVNRIGRYQVLRIDELMKVVIAFAMGLPGSGFCVL